MDKKEYDLLVKKHTPSEDRMKNIIVAFFTGGSIAFMAEFMSFLLVNCFAISEIEATSYVSILIIFLTSLFTGMGFFDEWVSKCKCGLIIPTTGFAHSCSSSALDYKKDGLITGLGSNVFKLAGSVILYGIISAFLLVVIKVVING